MLFDEIRATKDIREAILLAISIKLRKLDFISNVIIAMILDTKLWTARQKEQDTNVPTRVRGGFQQRRF